MTPIQHRSNRELLAALVGKTNAKRLSQRRLTELFGLTSGTENSASPLDDQHQERLLAARELICRALAEVAQHTDVLDRPAHIRELLRLRFSGLPHEVFVVLLLNAQHQLLDVVELFRGTLTQTSVYPREVVKLALARNAAAVVLAHNHPSGCAEPSHADQHVTQSLKQALALVDVKVLDHFIVAGTASPVSLAERGLV